MDNFKPSEKAKMALEAYRNKEIDQKYVMDMDLTREEAIWVVQEEFDLEGILARDELEEESTIRTWGTPACDRTIGMIEDHHSILVAGKQGDGKTSWLFHLAEENAKIGNVTLVYSLEMSCEQLIMTNAKKTAGITKEQWRDKSTISTRQKEVYRARKKELLPTTEKPLVLIGASEWKSKTIKDICNDALKYKEASLVIIDNLDLIQGSSDRMENNHRQEEISRYLLGWTNEHKIPVVMIHHLKKGGSGSIDDLRGSGKLSDDADVVIMLSRPFGEALSPADKRATDLFVAKERDWGDFARQRIYFDRGKFKDTFEGITSGFDNQ